MGLDLAPEALRALWGVEPGQLWTIRGARGTTHRLLVGDCRRAEDVARLMAGAHASIAFTSPPYASQRTYDEHRGRDAVRWAIHDRDRVAGGSIYVLTDNIDAGPVLAQEHALVRPNDTAESLWRRELFPIGVRLIERVLATLEAAHRAGCLLEAIASGTPQDEALATWEPSWDRAPLRRPDLLLLADGR